MCQEGGVGEAVKVLEGWIECRDESSVPSLDTFIKLMQYLAASEDVADATGEVERIFSTMQRLSTSAPTLAPTTPVYNSMMLVWSKSFHNNAGIRCEELLRELWSLYHRTNSSDFMPTKSSYICTMTAWARSGQGKEGAVRAEALLEEMEKLCAEFKSLSPTTVCVNVVL